MNPSTATQPNNPGQASTPPLPKKGGRPKAQPLTISVAIPAKEHARIADFCRRHRFNVEHYVAICGTNLDDLDSLEDDEQMRAWLSHQINQRFGNSVPVPPLAPPARTVTLEFSEQAFALLEATRAHDGHPTIEEWIRANVAGSVGSLCEYFTHAEEGEAELNSAFAAPVESAR